MAEENITVVDNAERRRYEVFIDDDLAGYSMYRDESGRRVFTHTKVDPDYEGHGVGGALARGAVQDARSRGFGVAARCPFIFEYLKRHPEYLDAG